MVLVVINPVIGITVLLMALIFAQIQKRCGDKIQNGMEVLRVEMGDLSSVINEMLNNITSIQMANLTELEKKRFDIKIKMLYNSLLPK